jgi:Bacteriophage lambda head decoration protein D
MPTYQTPVNLGDILGAHHDGNFNTQVSEIKAGIGVLLRGTVLATGTAGDIGKLVLLAAGTEAQSYGVLLDPAIDTGAAFSDGSVTGSIAKSGTFKGSALIVPAGVDAGLIAVALRGRGIFVEGPITVPAAAAVLEEERDEHRRAEDERHPRAAIEEQRRQRKE